MIDVQLALNRYFGYESLRDHQLKAVNSILEGKDVLVLTATGSGKSICYQLPALIKGIPVFVVSPLISLMEDQVLALREKGIQACDAKDFQLWLNSSVIYLSPEKLEGEIYNVEAIFKRRGILCFAIDECHCISEWGHDFRNSYRKLSILREKFPSVPIVALTATATPQITQDVISSLKLRNPIAVRSSFNRKNLFYEVKVKSNLNKDLTVEEIGNGSCIVYCLTKNDADSIANHLKKIGILADAYHSACTEMQRKKVHHSFLRDEIQCVVATVAFGMGIDKPDIRRIIHYGIPKSLEGYQQQTGRAGRDGAQSWCTMFWSMADFAVESYFVSQSTSKISQQVMNQNADKMREFINASTCRRKMLLKYFGENADFENCASCDICTNDQVIKTYDFNEEAKLLALAIFETQEKFGIGTPVDILIGTRSKALSERKFRGKSANELQSYGKSTKSKKWWTYFSQMLELEKVIEPYYSGQYRLFKLTKLGKDILSGNCKLGEISPSQALMQIDSNLRTQESGDWIHKARDRSKLPQTMSADLTLRKSLISLRKAIASERNIAPYMVFSESAIEALIRFQPQTLDEVLNLPHLTKVQAEKHGEKIIEVVKSWKNAESGSEIKSDEGNSQTISQNSVQTRVTPLSQGKFIPLKRKSLSLEEGNFISSQKQIDTESISKTEAPKQNSAKISSYMQQIWNDFIVHGSIPKICQDRLLRLPRVESIILNCISSGLTPPLEILEISPQILSDIKSHLSSTANPTLAEMASAARSLSLPDYPSWKLNIIRSLIS